MERRLGRGLGSLLGGGAIPEAVQPEPAPIIVDAAEAGQRKIALAQIHPNPHQPRVRFDEEHLSELVASIKNHGILQPICVRSAGEERFEIISGERRWRSAALAGLDSIPVVVRDEVSDEDMLELAIVENVQRQDLDAMEKARGYQDLMDRLCKTQQEVADRVGLKRSTVANHLRLLDLPPPIQDGVSKGMISMGHARAFLGLGDDTRLMLKLFEKTVRDYLSVRQVELEVKLLTNRSEEQEGQAKPEDKIVPWVTDIESKMQTRFGTRCQIKNAARGYKGQIVLHYHDRAELDRLISTLAPSEEL
ncbi:MAG: ParB family chromosome partitioning protein [Planctomycetota bacterium]|jgi:ParB family chromosome partitioning protein